jgi:hypothetical protein
MFPTRKFYLANSWNRFEILNFLAYYKDKIYKKIKIFIKFYHQKRKYFCQSEMSNIWLLLVTVSIFLFSPLHAEEIPIGCILWDNSFIQFSKNTQEKYFFIKISSRQRFGYIGIAALENPNKFENSFQILASTADTKLTQLTNHTQIVNKTIYNEFFDKLLFNRIDGILSFNFYVNISEMEGKNFFSFAQNERELPQIIGNFSYIPKHDKVSDLKFFLLNSTGNQLGCNDQLYISGRLMSQYQELFVVACFLYLLIAVLLIAFRNHQPLKSRFIGPHIVLFSLYVNLIGEIIPTMFTFEESSKYYCIFTAYLVYLAFHIA